jgi:hypothetical protein
MKELISNEIRGSGLLSFVFSFCFCLMMSDETREMGALATLMYVVFYICSLYVFTPFLHVTIKSKYLQTLSKPYIPWLIGKIFKLNVINWTHIELFPKSCIHLKSSDRNCQKD